LSQSILLRQRYSIILSFAIAAFLAVNLHPAAQLHNFLHLHPILELRHIGDIALSFIFVFIALMFNWIWQLRKLYYSEYHLGKYRAQYKNLLENLPTAVAEFDSEQQIKITNHTFKQFNQQIGDTTLKALVQQLFDKLEATENTTEVVLKQCYPDTDNVNKLWVEWRLHHRSGSTYLLLGRDISQQEDIQNKLSISQRILEDTPIGIMVVDTDKRIQYTNKSFEQITG